MTMTFANAQDLKQVPQITVSGEGIIKVTPDNAQIIVSVETTGNEATDVKKKNDIAIEAVVKFIKKMNLPKEDVLTQQVSLNKQYDYEKKKNYYNATQTINIELKDLSKYEALMNGLVEAGINKIEKVEFKSSKIEQLESEARKKAILNAKHKAEDFAGALGQKIGKAVLISDNSQTNYPRPMYASMKMVAGDSSMPRETLAVGDIDVTGNVTVSFLLN